MKKVSLLVAALIVCCSCGGQRAKKSEAGEATETTAGTAATATVREYKVPEIPAMMTDPQGAVFAIIMSPSTT